MVRCEKCHQKFPSIPMMGCTACRGDDWIAPDISTLDVPDPGGDVVDPNGEIPAEGQT